MTEMAAGIKQLMERIESEKASASTTELVLDHSNKVAFPGFPYVFEAAWKKIIVSIDVFKSGYECKVCKGAKRKEIRCECEDTDRPGFKYSKDNLESLAKAISPAVAESRAGEVCTKCKGDYLSLRRVETCPACEGRGAVLVLPETAKNLPTTGVVVSIGPGVRVLESGRTKYGYKIGDRVLFGPYSGNMVPTKAGLMFKILDANAPWCVIEGANELSQFDFIIQAE